MLVLFFQHTVLSLLTGGQCRAGTYCPMGSGAPLACLPGHYCGTDGLANVSGPCLAGYYCNVSATVSNPTGETFGDICPQGHYCPEASGYPQPCPEGTFSARYGNHNISSCLPCTAGQYCSGVGRDLPNGPCDLGWFCPAGSIVPQPSGNQCLAGHSCPSGSPAQTPCSSGQYQGVVGQGVCEPCPSGSYCDIAEAVLEEQSGSGAPSHGVVIPKVS